VACIGAGPASLTVARDLAPLGYEVTVFDGEAKAGGFIRTQIPRFRLPEIGDRRGGGLHPAAWASSSAQASASTR
jgi:NADPH-dependent glutamate synthase beta subunit-like oxidoreductase